MSFPQMAFWVIFPLATLIVLSGWVMIIISAVRKMRTPENTPGQAGKRTGENEAFERSSQIDPLPPMNWNSGEGIANEGVPSIPLT